MQETETFLRRPLIRLAGGVVTPGALCVGMVIVLVTSVLAGPAGRGLRRILRRRGLSPGAQFATVKIVRYVLTLIGLLVAVDSIGLSLSAVLAASTVLLVGIGFGLQNIAQNFISGLIVLFEQPICPGDFSLDFLPARLFDPDQEKTDEYRPTCVSRSTIASERQASRFQFPQRDLHVRSSSADASLTGPRREEVRKPAVPPPRPSGVECVTSRRPSRAFVFPPPCGHPEERIVPRHGS